MRSPRTGTADPRSFDHLPRHYDRFAELVGGPLLDYITERLPTRGGRAVDLGCGPGQHAALLASRYDEVLAVDNSAPMVRFASEQRPRPNVCYRHCDLLDVKPDRDGTFDLVLSAFTLHHVPDLSAALEQIRSLVRPGGQAILVDICDLPRDPAWFRAEARQTLLLDLRHRRRPIRDAVLLYRLSVHPAWLDHLAADIALTRAEFEQVYLATFATAEITPMYPARAVHWQHPEP